MNWSNIFLLSFVVGFAMSLFSFLGGALHLPHLHLHTHGKGGVTFFPAIVSFLTWFGAAGYLLTQHSSVSAVLTIAASLLIGALGSWLIIRLLSPMLTDEHPLSADDYRMVGVLGRVSSPIREGGTGEMIYSLQGTRRGVPIRSEDAVPISRGTEVVVTRFERGIAYVKQWDELSS